jgi:protoheme IX farnesyltransferase
MWLKRSTPQNIVIGGAAGALPPVVGWAAVTNTVTIEPIVLFAIIFLWTPPHFWALALFKRGDYERAGVPMLPNVAGDANTRLQIFIYSLLVAVSGVLPTILGFASLFYGAVSAALGICFIWYAWKVWQNAGRDKKLTAEKQLFGFSLLYLFAVFAVLLVDSFVLKIWG